jgi:GntR family transcriptional repressor for pyruvate dehydrogenase complex
MNKKQPGHSVFDTLISELQNVIYQHQPGDRLPPERVLAEQLGTTRPSLREALKVLEACRLIDIRHGSGIYVQDYHSQATMGALALRLTSHEGLAHENMIGVFEARRIIEAASVYRAALRATEDDVKAMQDALQAQRQSVEADKMGMIEAEDFHLAIARASKNLVITRILNDLYLISNSWRSRYNIDFGFWREAPDEHQEVLDAIAQHRPVIAVQLIQHHLLKFERAVVHMLGMQDQWHFETDWQKMQGPASIYPALIPLDMVEWRF